MLTSIRAPFGLVLGVFRLQSLIESFRQWQSRPGPGLAEYALITLLIGIVAITMLTTLSLTASVVIASVFVGVGWLMKSRFSWLVEYLLIGLLIVFVAIVILTTLLG